jgi:hypothetical protein
MADEQRKPVARDQLSEALRILAERQEEQRRRYRDGFDGLLGRIPDGASALLVTIIREVQRFLLRKYSEDKARVLLEAAKSGMVAHPDMNLIPEGDLLALTILNKIHRALDAEGERYLDLLLGKAGAQEHRRREASKRERHPEITAWIRRQLTADPGAKSPDLWGRAPNSIKDVVGEGRFRKRVTAERKRMRKDASK